ncbi:DUF6162 family protein [Vibrio alfacsensis]|uniref:DUF6162 family protein n=1 Tax=Vibrio alfacsensis TaxID=1074311 RepID=UPI004067D0E7
MMTQKIRPDNGSREGKWVALTIAGILAMSVILLPHHQSETEHIEAQAHQVLMTDLKQDDLSMIADLKLAHEEIRDLYLDAGAWPEISELEAFWVAPFVNDQSWQRKGAHQWQRLDSGLYLGLRQDEHGAASMLLDSRSERADIWFSHVPVMAQVQSLQAREKRQQQGWQQIVLSPSSSSNLHAH